VLSGTAAELEALAGEAPAALIGTVGGDGVRISVGGGGAGTPLLEASIAELAAAHEGGLDAFFR
jgi:hypothetical protein